MLELLTAIAPLLLSVGQALVALLLFVLVFMRSGSSHTIPSFLWRKVMGGAPNGSSRVQAWADQRDAWIYFRALSALAARTLPQSERMILWADRHDEEVDDTRRRGTYSDSTYQIDALPLPSDGGKADMAEAKDYTVRARGGDQGKVGRGDIQKLSGALSDLDDVGSGAFFSATGYTKPARQYADAASSMPLAKPIRLHDFSPYEERDLEGRVRRIVLSIHQQTPLVDEVVLRPILSDLGEKALRGIPGLTEDDLRITVEEFVDASGMPIGTVSELTSRGYGDLDTETRLASGCYVFDGHHVLIRSVPIELFGIEYQMPYHFETATVTIEDSSEHRLTLRTGSGELILVFTDAMLREFSFSEDGRVERLAQHVRGAQP